MTTSGRHDPLRFADDPVVEGWLQHLRREPIPASQELLLIRRWLTREAGDGPCGAQAACWRDLKRAYMELRPRLRRNYATTNLPEVYAPVLAPLSGGPIPNGAVEIDGRAYHGLVLDFGPSSVDGWLTRIAAAELGLPEDDLLDVRRRQLLVDGQRIDLTSLEFEVLHYLRQHEGATVPRYALLTDVWGYQADIGSNVVEAVVHALRKKLGARASMIETVRGVGYRLR
jgi:Transcriptional regulatory protein, C terminal